MYYLKVQTHRVPTGLESQVKPGKIKWSGKVKELLCFQKVRNFCRNASYCEIKKCRNFHRKKVGIIISYSR